MSTLAQTAVALFCATWVGIIGVLVIAMTTPTECALPELPEFTLIEVGYMVLLLAALSALSLSACRRISTYGRDAWPASYG